MSITIFMWCVIILLAYITFVVTNHSNTCDKQAEFLGGKISGLSHEMEEIKAGCKRAVRDSADERHERVRDTFDEMLSSVNKIKTISEENHKWIMANHTLVSTTYRLSMATNRRTHVMDIQLDMALPNYDESNHHEDEWYECAEIIRNNGKGVAEDFINKMNEE
ncbi:hypothetical protein ACU63M_21935 [Klebsiella aerogenes]